MFFSKTTKEVNTNEIKQIETYDVQGENNKIIIVERGGVERDITHSEKIPGIEIVIHGNNNLVYLTLPIKAVGSTINILNNNATVRIGTTFLFDNVIILCSDGNNQNVEIGTEVTMHNVGIVASEDSEIRIGQGCMFSARVYIYGSDGHAMYDIKTGACINGRKHATVIGERCWISSDVMILKSAVIPSNSVIAAGSVVTKNFSQEESNICLAGNPAKVVRRDIDWSYESPSERVHRMSLDKKELKLSSEELKWSCGQEGRFSIYLNDCKICNSMVEWQSENTEVCVVNEYGEVHCKTCGKTRIIATYAGQQAICEVEVV